jgi:hypothetical protein
MNEKVGSRTRIDNGDVQVINVGDWLPVAEGCAAQGIYSELDSGIAYDVYIDDVFASRGHRET